MIPYDAIIVTIWKYEFVNSYKTLWDVSKCKNNKIKGERKKLYGKE
jgi:hypothetical protein